MISIKHALPLVTMVILCWSSAQAAPPATWSQSYGAEMVWYSYAAYCPQSQIQSWSCTWCKKVGAFTTSEVFVNKSADSLAFVGFSTSSQQIMVVFRGTSNIQNWLADADFVQTPYPAFPNAMVHKGFNDVYNGLKPGIITELKTLVSKYGFPIIVSGHSLGGALATLCTADIAKNAGSYFGSGAHQIYQWDFGRPRVGNKAFATGFQGLKIPTWRHVNQKDIVPHVPPEALNYYHTTQEVWEHANCQFQQCSSTNGEDPNCSDSLSDPDSVSDHLNYFEYLYVFFLCTSP